MRKEIVYPSRDIPTRDCSIFVGVRALCQESSDILRQAAISVNDPRIRHTLGEIAQSRETLSQELDVGSEQGSDSEIATDMVEEGRANYEQIKHRLSFLPERDLLEAICLADVSAAQNLRESVRAVTNSLVACQLSSAVAKFQMDSDRLRTHCTHTQIQH